MPPLRQDLKFDSHTVVARQPLGVGAMAEGYQDFLDFDWSHSGWHDYLKNLYPPPDEKKLLKFKKKWYKKNVDPDFDDTYEPPAAAPEASDGPSANGMTSAKAAKLLASTYADGSRWKKMGPKTTICFAVYCIALTFAIGATAGVFPPYQALVVLIASFILEIFAKYGLKFNSEYMYSVLLDDVGVMPMLAVTLLTPGLHYGIRILALVPPFLTAFLSFCQICKAHPRLPSLLRDFFAPVADLAARYKVMQVRADVEVVLGFVLVGGGLTMRAAPVSVLLFWNMMMMRYMMNPFTQATFGRMDATLSPVCCKFPGIRHGYLWLKRSLFSFVDPQSKRAGKMCTIL